MENKSGDEISEFFRGSEIFITGGTGNLGQAAIEKLLRSCDVAKIYMLLRQKRNQSIEQRLEKFKTSLFFRTLKSSKPGELNKLVAIAGDAKMTDLGISPEHTELMKNVSVVFHCAATVNFNEPLDVALDMNVGGTLRALHFAEKLRNLKLFMHVSTYFSNPYLSYVEPKVYAPPMDWKLGVSLLGQKSLFPELDSLTKKLITGFPNTYCFTKNISESLVNDYRDRLPVAIYRPSIVLSCATEPEPGFPPTPVGAPGMIFLCTVGMKKVIFVERDIRLDVVPMDISTKVMLANTVLAAKEYEKKGKSLEEAPVSVSSSTSIMVRSMRSIVDLLHDRKVWVDNQPKKAFLIPGAFCTSSGSMFFIYTIFLEVLPALLFDSILKLFGRKGVIYGITKKAYDGLRLLTPFLFNEYVSEGFSNMTQLRKITAGTPFAFEDDLRCLSTDEGLFEYNTNMCRKMNEVYLGERETDFKIGKKLLKVKIIVYNIIRVIILYYLMRWMWRSVFQRVQVH